MTLPVDEGLPGLPLLFDGSWVWQTFCNQFGEPEEPPHNIRAIQISYRPGERDLVSYAAEWRHDRWIVDDQFAIEMTAGKQNRLFRYPDDPYLPGLPKAASPVEAHDLLVRHVPVSPHKLRVEVVRYRPATRAVLRQVATWRQARTGNVTLYVRVVPSKRVERLLTAFELAERSTFSVPRIVGQWDEGGVVWMTNVPGETVRSLIQRGAAPDPNSVLDGLDQLWPLGLSSGKGQPLNLLGGYEMTERLLSRLLVSEDSRDLLQRVSDVLGPFAQAWKPTGLAHNDFYDDQVLLTPEGKLALVDFEEAGPGDPMVDVGNLLAHLRWMALFGNAAEENDAFRRCSPALALDRFGWEEHDLDLREAFAIFRLTAGPFRQLRPTWAKRATKGLELATQVLAGAD